MLLAIRLFESAVSIWLTALYFLVYSIGASTTKRHKETLERQTPNLAPDANVAINPHSPVGIHNHHNHLGWVRCPSYHSEQLGFVVWAGCCFFGISWAVFVLRDRLRHTKRPEQPSTTAKPGGEPTYRQVGRRPAIASGRQLSSSGDPSEPDASSLSSSTASEAPSSAHGRRGKQFASHDFSSSPTLPPWKIKEPHTVPLGKDRMPSLTTVIQGLQFEEKRGSMDQELNRPISSSVSRARLYPIQASPPLQANINDQPSPNDPIVFGRLRRIKAKTKDRFIPYPSLVSHGVRRRRRGLTPGTVETCHVKRKSSLEIALFGNPYLLQPDPITWFILIVAVDYHHLQDPEHDLEFWKKMLDDPALDSEMIYFAELTGKQATPENIKKELAQLYHDSGALVTVGRPNLFVYLTGEGDDQNRMHLLGGRSVSEEDIDQWLREFRATWGYTRPTTLVLDICRTNKHKPSARMHHGVELICSSSPGEKALALRFKSEQDTPYSSFMLAFVIASSISPTSTGPSFISAIEHRLQQFSNLVRLATSREDPGVSVDLGPQQPDYSQARNLTTFLELARMLSRTRVAHAVHDFVTQISYFREEDTKSDSILEYGPSTENRTNYHLRGASGRAPAVGS
ncbi:unnamed protein product [Rhizoctonia solani]|uniref:Uncharacterized protein n=1 Tax=Rhizoctonia solani TaxID=456999 RepID=A0A8H3B1Q7_9AGAM|nr:unnamed protein product [Rhizoctonia solani]